MQDCNHEESHYIESFATLDGGDEGSYEDPIVEVSQDSFVIPKPQIVSKVQNSISDFFDRPLINKYKKLVMLLLIIIIAIAVYYLYKYMKKPKPQFYLTM